MTGDELTAIGQGYWGLFWKSPMARFLGVRDRKLRRWAGNQEEIPPWVDEELQPLREEIQERTTNAAAPNTKEK